RLDIVDPVRAGHDHTLYLQRLEDLDRRGLLHHRGDVVVADEQHNRALLGQTLDAPRELAHVGGVRLAVLEGVPGEDGEIGVVLAGIINDLIHPEQEVHHTGADACGWVDLAVVLHADVNIGEVQQSDRFRHDSCPPLCYKCPVAGRELLEPQMSRIILSVAHIPPHRRTVYIRAVQATTAAAAATSRSATPAS